MATIGPDERTRKHLNDEVTGIAWENGTWKSILSPLLIMLGVEILKVILLEVS